MMKAMSNLKTSKKALDFGWVAKPYRATWAFTPEDVPIWDASRGFPVEIPDAKLHFFASDDEVEDVPYPGLTVFRHEGESDLDYLRWILENAGIHHNNWQPSRPPERGYPRLVRANYTDPIYLQDCEQKDVINSLVRLLRDEPKPPGVWVMKDIVNLTAEVGPAKTHEENTLAGWLGIAHLVKAQLKARESLFLSDYDQMCEDVEQWNHEYRTGVYVGSDPAKTKNPYASLHNICFVVNYEHREKSMKQREAVFLKTVIGQLRFAIRTLQRSDHGFYSLAPLESWVSYQLARIWTPGAKVLECQGCRQPFFTMREGKAMCSGRCRTLKSERATAERKKL